ncbi:hypothetical protein Cgig2_023883 [Carnegiea gigantea]|uniref:Uncharacterized protein n=1 Tax=Carnegiea gigantea TaxID=171969 RepID=A0A9Q1JMG9_9CARY|nr:hypothetical protein Cgig2_023883 [Carnegiea gigantea]
MTLTDTSNLWGDWANGLLRKDSAVNCKRGRERLENNLSKLQSIHACYLSYRPARKNAVREQKLQMELSAAKKERDFYLSKVEQSRALKEIQERMKKKRKVQDGAETDCDHPVELRKPKMTRQFPQKQPLTMTAEKPKLSKDAQIEDSDSVMKIHDRVAIMPEGTLPRSNGLNALGGDETVAERGLSGPEDWATTLVQDHAKILCYCWAQFSSLAAQQSL